MAQLRAQLAQGLAELRTAQGQQDAALSVLRGRCEGLEGRCEALAAPPEAPAAAEGGEELRALLQRHESHAAEVKSRCAQGSHLETTSNTIGYNI